MMSHRSQNFDMCSDTFFHGDNVQIVRCGLSCTVLKKIELKKLENFMNGQLCASILADEDAVCPNSCASGVWAPYYGEES